MHLRPASRIWLLLATVLFPLSAVAQSPNPVVLELFTSEGCSSCPPADRLLASLERQQNPDYKLIVVSEHVDYWNYLGWKDPFSSSEYTHRQRKYARALGQNTVYTPEMVVDGLQGFTGSDSNAASVAIDTASHRKKNWLSLKAWLNRDKRTVAFNVSNQAQLADNERLIIFLTEDGLSVNVKSGENSGRVLNHSAVSRAIKVFDQIPPDKTSILLPPSVGFEQLNLVALIQNIDTMKISAAGVCDIKSER